MLRAAIFVLFLLWSLVSCVAKPQSDAWQRAMRDGMALYEAERFADAAPLFEQALRIAEEEFDPQDPNLQSLAQPAAMLAVVTQARAESRAGRVTARSEEWQRTRGEGIALALQTGRLADSTPLFEQALRIAEEEFDARDPRLAMSLNNLASAYQEQRRYAEAEPLHRRALAIYEQRDGPEDPGAGAALQSLGLIYRAQGRYAESEPLRRRGLANWEVALRPEHPNAATNLTQLANEYEAEGLYAEAEPLHRRALAIREQALGPEHPDVATSLQGLAILYTAQGRYAEAEPLARRALAIVEPALGPEHPQVASILGTLASLYTAQGRYAEAESLYRRSLALYEQTLGPESRQFGATLGNLGMLQFRQGRIAEAEGLLRQAIMVIEAALGPDHPRLGEALNNLALFYGTMGTVCRRSACSTAHAKSESLQRRALAIWEARFGPDHPHVAGILLNLANLYLWQVRYPEAEPLLSRALAIFKARLGPEHPTVATSLFAIAGLHRAQGRYAEALSPIRGAAAIHRQRAERRPNLRAGPGDETAPLPSIFDDHVAIAWAARGIAADAELAGEALEAAQLASAGEMAAVAVRTAARFASGDDALAALVRQQEGAAERWRVLDRAIVAASARSPTERNPVAERALKDEVTAVTARLDAIKAKLRQRFPEYSALVSPAPVPLAEVQALLGPEEALLATLFVGDRSEDAMYV